MSILGGIFFVLSKQDFGGVYDSRRASENSKFWGEIEDFGNWDDFRFEWEDWEDWEDFGDFNAF